MVWSDKSGRCGPNAPQCYIICAFPILFVTVIYYNKTNILWFVCLFDGYCSRMWLQVDYWMCTNTSDEPVALILSKLKTFMYIYHTTWCHTLEDSSTIYITITITMRIPTLSMFVLFLHLFPSNRHYTISQLRFWTFFI